MPEQQSRGQLSLDLDCSACDVRAASFAPGSGGEGGLLSFSIGPLSEDTVTALDRAAHSHTPVRLRFSKHPLLLELLKLERKDAQCVRIVAHVLPASSGDVGGGRLR